MLTLYYHAGACSLAPHIALEWIGAPYETKEVEFGDKEYLKINPSGAVPALDTGEGWILTQAAAVLRYLADRFPQAGLAIGGSPRDEAEADRWSSFMTGDLHPAFFPLFSPNRYTRARKKEAIDDVREAAKALVGRKFDVLDAHLAGRRFFVGDARCYLDAFVFPMERWAASMLEDGLSKFPNVRSHS
ncbi:MAG: glutathione S-transferase family protein, partial [Methylocystis sp.]|uniref:glutathione S-transferase family protein n=1 Tax=Methylocystis sp. TaxID=1911079 RepID=UPI003D103EAC